MRQGYADQFIPDHALASAASSWRVDRAEAELRMRAVLQMSERLLRLLEGEQDHPGFDRRVWADESGPLARRLWQQVEVLAGHSPAPLGTTREQQAELVATTFCPADETDVRRLPRRWWDSPLGVLCARSLVPAGKVRP